MNWPIYFLLAIVPVSAAFGDIKSGMISGSDTPSVVKALVSGMIAVDHLGDRVPNGQVLDLVELQKRVSREDIKAAIDGFREEAARNGANNTYIFMADKNGETLTKRTVFEAEDPNSRRRYRFTYIPPSEVGNEPAASIAIEQVRPYLRPNGEMSVHYNKLGTARLTTQWLFSDQLEVRIDGMPQVLLDEQFQQEEEAFAFLKNQNASRPRIREILETENGETIVVAVKPGLNEIQLFRGTPGKMAQVTDIKETEVEEYGKKGKITRITLSNGQKLVIDQLLRAFMAEQIATEIYDRSGTKMSTSTKLEPNHSAFDVLKEIMRLKIDSSQFHIPNLAPVEIDVESSVVQRDSDLPSILSAGTVDALASITTTSEGQEASHSFISSNNNLATSSRPISGSPVLANLRDAI